MQDLIGDVDIERIEYSFSGKLFQRIRDNRAEKRDERQANKMERINARQAGGGVIGKIGGALQGIFGKNTPSEDPALMQERGFTLGYTDPNQLALEQQKKTQNMIITIIVIIVVVTIIALFVMKNKKSKAA